MFSKQCLGFLHDCIDCIGLRFIIHICICSSGSDEANSGERAEEFDFIDKKGWTWNGDGME